MKKFLKKNNIYIINILSVLSIFLIALIISRISPFGSKMLGNADGIIQYKPMLYDFITKIKTHTLTNFSFNNGLGNPFIFNYIYYLSSPFNLIAIFFKSPDAMYLSTILIKLLIGSLTMTLYAKSKTDNKFIIFIATLSYVFSSWFIAHYYMISWLDIFVLFPLYQKGLEDLLNNNKPSIYIISLCLLTICNFYLALTVYIYTIIYFIIHELLYKKNSLKDKYQTFLRIMISTIISFVMIFFFVYFIFDTYSKSSIPLDNYITSNYIVSFKGFIQSLLYSNIHVQLELGGPTFPNLACNHLILINLLYFFCNSKINKKDKIFALSVILIIIAAIFIKRFDFILNFFHQVRGFTFRYSYIISFLMIAVFIKNASTLEEKDYKKMLYTMPIIILLLLISFKNMETTIRVFTICSILVYIILLGLYIDNKYYKLLICLVVIIQSLLAFRLNLNTELSKENFRTNSYNKENVKYRKNVDNKEGEYLNSNLYHNSKVTYLMTSLTYNNVIMLSENLGCSTFLTSSIVCSNNSEITNLLFNIKNDSDYYLEKVFAVNKNILLTDSGVFNTVKDNTERIITAMTNIEDIYTKIILKAKIDNDYYIFKTDAPFYLIEIKNEDGTSQTVPQVYKEFKQKIKDGDEEAIIYTINKEKLKEVYDYLKTNQIEYTYYNDDHLEGTINVDENQIIFTSIPYDESWKITIDGKEVKPTMVLDSLIGIEVEPGKHTISMKYSNSSYIAPSIISIITFIGFIIFNIKRKN
ncbi:MAG: YfhO family protein [Bacilli bacterium]|nr:YfhO family protein [Bacilli bacterium]